MPFRLVLHPLGQVFFFVADDALLFKLGLERVIQCAVSRDKARVQHGGLGQHVQVGLLDGSLDGPCGMAHFESDIPERPQDRLNNPPDLRRNHRSLVQEHQVHVAIRIEFAPAKAPDGHQGDAAACLMRSRPVGRGVIQVAQNDIHEDRALPGNLASASARLMFEPQAVIFDPQEFFIKREEFRLVIHPLRGEFLLRVGEHQFPVPGGAGRRAGINRGNGFGFGYRRSLCCRVDFWLGRRGGFFMVAKNRCHRSIW